VDLQSGGALRVKVIVRPGSGEIIGPVLNRREHVTEILKCLHSDVTIVYDSGNVHGNSWEMAAVLVSLGFTGTFSGCVQSFDRASGQVTFGRIGGVKIKRRLGDVKFWYDIPQVNIFCR
jgi:hypothetical protein